MGLSLRDQLLQAGFQEKKPEPKPPASKDRHGEKPTPPSAKGKDRDQRHRAQHSKPAPSRPVQNPAPPKPVDPASVSLAHAYHLRAETEKREREEAQRRAEEAARIKREQRLKLQQLVAGKALNDKDAEHVRNFSYGKKIRKVNVTPQQLSAINGGDMGVVQVEGRFLILAAEHVRAVMAIAPHHVAVFIPDSIGVSSSSEDDYNDPRFQVPDDLVW